MPHSYTPGTEAMVGAIWQRINIKMSKKTTSREDKLPTTHQDQEQNQKETSRKAKRNKGNKDIQQFKNN